MASNWVIRIASNGYQVHSPYLIWRSGIMNQAPGLIDHTVVAMDLTDENAVLTIVIHDVGEFLVPPGNATVPTTSTPVHGGGIRSPEQRVLELGKVGLGLDHDLAQRMRFFTRTTSPPSWRPPWCQDRLPDRRPPAVDHPGRTVAVAKIVIWCRAAAWASAAKSGGPAGGGGSVRAWAGSPTSVANCSNPAGVCRVRNRAVAEVTRAPAPAARRAARPYAVPGGLRASERMTRMHERALQLAGQLGTEPEPPLMWSLAMAAHSRRVGTGPRVGCAAAGPRRAGRQPGPVGGKRLPAGYRRVLARAADRGARPARGRDGALPA